jgi:manganese efflux pump family protein
MAITDFLSILLIAVSLSIDCFAVAVSGSLKFARLSWPPILRTAFSFGFAQFIMPVIGWLLGKTLADLIADYDHWAAFILLAFVGGRMIWESFESGDGNRSGTDITRGLPLLSVAFATSIDSLAAGLGLGFIKINIWYASSIIGLTAFILTVLGFLLGSKVGKIFGKRARLVGGLVLIAIGVRILVSHLSAG